MAKLISVVTPAFNSASTLEECLLSVCSQGHLVEHIVVDGGSSDGTIDLLKKYEHQYNLRWISEPDRGIADAMNKGFRLARGEVVAWLDADNYYQEGVIDEIAALFQGSDIDIVYGNVNYVDNSRRVVGTYVPPVNIGIETIFGFPEAFLLSQVHFSEPAYLRRSAALTPVFKLPVI